MSSVSGKQGTSRLALQPAAIDSEVAVLGEEARLPSREQIARAQTNPDRRVVVDGLECHARLHQLLEEAGHRVLEVALVERAVLRDHVPHALQADARPSLAPPPRGSGRRDDTR